MTVPSKPTRVSLTDARNMLGPLIKRVYRGEEVIITARGEDAARLAAVAGQDYESLMTMQLGHAARQLLVALNENRAAFDFMGLCPELGPGAINQVSKWVRSYRPEGESNG